MLTPQQEAEAERRQHFILKQLVFFWPLVSNADDADRVEHLNYQLCFAYAAWNLVSGLLDLFFYRTGPIAVLPILLILSFVLFYFLGGNAVRQNSVPAAWAMAVLTSLPVVQRIAEHRFNATVFLFFLGSLVVLRGTILTARWRRNEAAPSPDPLRLERMLPLQFDRRRLRSMADRWSPGLWPRLQWLFWLTGTLLLAEPIFLAVLIFREKQ